MSKHIQLSIPTPCHEDWNKMSPVEKGKFCGSCQKKVIDFSTMSDREIATFFKKTSTGSVCGRFMEDQLDRSIEIPKKRIPWVKYFFQITIPLFLASLKATAQGNVIIKTNRMVYAPSIKGENKSFPSFSNSILGDTIYRALNNISPVIVEQTFTGTIGGVVVNSEIERISISGKVVDSNGVGISYATVTVKDEKQATVCDDIGNFTLAFKKGIKKVTLVSSCVGFVPTEKHIDLTKDSFTDIVLMQNNQVNGEVVVTANTGRHVRGLVGTTSIISWGNSQEKVKKIKNNQICIYPNPIKTNSALNVELNQKETGTYSLQLFNISGQLLFTKETWIDNETILNLQLPSVSAGNYFLRMTNKKSGKSYTEKIIVQ